ncbi:MAG: 50S ribosomal protein L11 methyltransferase [Candidatus Promineifilaceae bacterium]
MNRYRLSDLGNMVNKRERNRVSTYYKAMAAVIHPDSIVLEIGTGIGFFAMLACQLGARHVYAVEPNPLISLGKELAAANGFAKQITFINDVSQSVSLPELADVVISDIRGSLPWLTTHIPTIQDARTRLLNASGVQIPMRDSVQAAIVHAPEAYDRRIGVWEDSEFGLDLSAARKRIVNVPFKARISAENLLSQPINWAKLDYRTITNPDAKGALRFTVNQAGVAHGVSMWFDSELTSGVFISNAPDQPHNPMYSQTLFPFERPIALEIGDTVHVNVQTKLVNKQYSWIWHTQAYSATGVEKANFRQSTFWAKQWGSLNRTATF